MIANRTELYKLTWSPDGKTVKETFFPEGRPFGMIKWKINKLRTTTHKSGVFIPVPINVNQTAKQ